MTRLRLLAPLLFALLPHQAEAQQQRPAQQQQGLRIECPASIRIQVQRVVGVPDRTGTVQSLEGFTPVFAPDTTVRVFNAYAGLGEPANPDARPGTPLRYVLWNGRPPAPTADPEVRCVYEGEIQLSRAVPRTTRGCSIVLTPFREPPGSTRRNDTLTSAVATCR